MQKNLFVKIFRAVYHPKTDSFELCDTVSKFEIKKENVKVIPFNDTKLHSRLRVGVEVIISNIYSIPDIETFESTYRVNYKYSNFWF